MYVIYRVLHDMNQLCPFTGWLHEWFPPSAILKASFMRTPRKLIPIPPRVVAGIDKIAGLKQRTSFIVDLLEREIRRHDQIEALREARGLGLRSILRRTRQHRVQNGCWGINGTENQVKVTRVFADSVHRPSVIIQPVAVSPSAFPIALTNFRPN